jgi:Domain of unknown function (DUF4124)
MRTALLLLLAASGLTGTASAADVWKWVDSSGVTHYSDQPVPGAIKIEVRTGNVAESQPANAVAPRSAASDFPADATRYRDFAIYRPEVDQSIINTGGQVNVEIRIDPEVQPLHTLSLYLDGKLVSGSPPNSLSYVLTEVPRGVHSVTAVITDQSGRTIQETSPVGFNVRQESIANPPVGPTLRPQPPKPQPRGAANKVLTTQPSYGALNGALPAVNPATNMPLAPKPAPKPKKP